MPSLSQPSSFALFPYYTAFNPCICSRSLPRPADSISNRRPSPGSGQRRRRNRGFRGRSRPTRPGNYTARAGRATPNSRLPSVRTPIGGRIAQSSRLQPVGAVHIGAVALGVGGGRARRRSPARLAAKETSPARPAAPAARIAGPWLRRSSRLLYPPDTQTPRTVPRSNSGSNCVEGSQCGGQNGP